MNSTDPIPAQARQEAESRKYLPAALAILKLSRDGWAIFSAYGSRRELLRVVYTPDELVEAIAFYEARPAPSRAFSPVFEIKDDPLADIELDL